MLDAAASSAARDAGSGLALEAEARKTVRKSSRVDAHRQNVQVWTSLVFRGPQA
jgi:hypothetical protein